MVSAFKIINIKISDYYNLKIIIPSHPSTLLINFKTIFWIKVFDNIIFTSI